MLELEHVSAVVAVVCEAVSQPCSPVTYSVSAALLGLTRLLLLVLTVVACSSNGHQVHVCAPLGSACCISFIDATSLPIRLIDSSLNPTPCDSMKLCKQTRQMDEWRNRQTDVFILLRLWGFVWTPSAPAGLAMTIAVPHSQLPYLHSSHCARRYTEIQLTYFSQTGWRKCLSRWTTSYDLQFTDNFIKYLFQGKSWWVLEECIFYLSLSLFRYFCNS